MARSLRDSSSSAAEQGRLNWATVQSSYTDDPHGAERAEVRLNAMITKERDRERSRQATRQTFHDLNPIHDEEISRNIRGEGVPIPTPQRGQSHDEANNASSSGSNQQDPENAMDQGDDRAPAPNGANRNQRRNTVRNTNGPRGRRNPSNRRSGNRSRSRSPFNRGQRNRDRSRNRSRGRNDRNGYNGYNNRRGNSSSANRGRNERNVNAQWAQARNGPENQGSRGSRTNPRDSIQEVVERCMAEFERQRGRQNAQQ